MQSEGLQTIQKVQAQAGSSQLLSESAKRRYFQALEFKKQETLGQTLMETFTESAPIRPWILYAIAYGGICFAAEFVRELSQGVQLAILLPAIFSTIQLSAIWSVFGPSRFLVRALSAMAVGAIVLGGALLGALATLETTSSWIEVYLAVGMVMPMLFCASQIPYWILRTAFGWQFVFEKHPPAPSFQLRDLFAITFIIAIAFVGLQGASASYITQFDNMTLVEDTSLTVDTLAKAELAKRGAMQVGLMFRISLIVPPVFIFLSMLTMPFVFLVFRTKNAGRSILYCAIAGGASLLIAIICTSIRAGMLIGIAGIGALIVAAVAWTIIAFVLPLLTCRLSGISLTTFAQHQSENERSVAATGTVV